MGKAAGLLEQGDAAGGDMAQVTEVRIDLHIRTEGYAADRV